MTSPSIAVAEPADPGTSPRPPAAEQRRFGWLTWKRWLAFGGAAMAVRMVMPSGESGQALALFVSLLSVIAIWVGVLRVPRADRRPALVFAVGMTVYFVGDLFFYFFLLVRHSPRPYPSLAEAFYVTDLPIFIAGLLLFIRRQRPGPGPGQPHRRRHRGHRLRPGLVGLRHPADGGLLAAPPSSSGSSACTSSSSTCCS